MTSPSAPEMGEEQLAELERLAKAATPWSNNVRDESCAQCRKDKKSEWAIDDLYGGYHDMFSDETQARFIATANPAAILALLSAYRMVVGERTDLREMLEDRGRILEEEIIYHGASVRERDDALRERDELKRENEDLKRSLAYARHCGA